MPRSVSRSALRRAQFQPEADLKSSLGVLEQLFVHTCLFLGFLLEPFSNIAFGRDPSGDGDVP